MKLALTIMVLILCGLGSCTVMVRFLLRAMISAPCLIGSTLLSEFVAKGIVVCFPIDPLAAEGIAVIVQCLTFRWCLGIVLAATMNREASDVL